MKLERRDIVLGHCGAETRTVLGAAQAVLGVFELREVAVHEVEPGLIRHALPQRVRAILLHLVPAHVRHFQALAFAGGGVLETGHGARDQAQRVDAVVLVAAIQQHLHAQADAQQRLVLRGLDHHLVQLQSPQLIHAAAHAAHAGQHQAVTLEQFFRVIADLHPVRITDSLQRFGQRVQVAHAVINDAYGFHVPGYSAWR